MVSSKILSTALLCSTAVGSNNIRSTWLHVCLNLVHYTLTIGFAYILVEIMDNMGWP